MEVLRGFLEVFWRLFGGFLEVFGGLKIYLKKIGGAGKNTKRFRPYGIRILGMVEVFHGQTHHMMKELASNTSYEILLET